MPGRRVPFCPKLAQNGPISPKRIRGFARKFVLSDAAIIRRQNVAESCCGFPLNRMKKIMGALPVRESIGWLKLIST